jgi:site-specific DNA-methyltransferase (adenine-specific)/modification methylase
VKGSAVAFEEVIIGNARLIHGDCREVLPLLPHFAAVVTDPPYGLGDILHRSGKNNPRWGKHFGAGPPTWDRDTVADGVLTALAHADKAVVWGGQFYLLQPSRCWLSWNKIIRNWSSSEAEHAWTNLDKPNRVFDYSHGQLATEGKHYHPTQKPVPLMAWCLVQAGRPATVCDPFMGSGSTGVACMQLGLGFTGIERERQYFDSACERIERAQRQGTLLPPEKAPQFVQESLV